MKLGSRFLQAAAFLLLAGATWLEAGASGLVKKAREKVDAGTVVPETDLAPLVDALQRTGSNGEASTLISGIAELGNATGNSPAAVKAYLVQTGGIAAARLTTAGLGDTKPVGDNTTEEGRGQNRRVELVRK